MSVSVLARETTGAGRAVFPEAASGGCSDMVTDEESGRARARLRGEEMGEKTPSEKACDSACLYINRRT